MRGGTLGLLCSPQIRLLRGLQLLLSGVLYSALTNAGLAVRSLPFATALVIKNGNIIANMVVGRLAGRRYTTWQV